MGWMPSFPQFDRNPLELADEADAAGVDPAEHVVSELKAGPAELRGRRPERAVELPARVLRVALEPARLLGQGAGVLPAPPARRRPRRSAGRAAARGRAPVERALARGDPARQARPAGHRRLPHDHDRPVLRRRAAGGDLVREVRPVDDRHAPVRALVQPGGAAAVGGAQRLGHVPHDRAQVLRAGRRASRRPPRRGGHPGPARHARRARPAARRGGRLAGGRVRAGARAHDAQPDRRRARLRRRGRASGRRSARWPSSSARTSRARRGSRTARSRGWPRATGARSAALPTADRRWSAPSTPPRRCSRSRASPTAASAAAGFRSLRGALRRAARRPGRGLRGDADHLPGRAGPAAPRDHLAGVVGHRRGGPLLRRVHDQRRARQALAHAVGTHAPLPRPRVDARARRGPARLPAAGRPPADARRRAADRRRRRAGDRRCAT